MFDQYPVTDASFEGTTYQVQQPDDVTLVANSVFFFEDEDWRLRILRGQASELLPGDEVLEVSDVADDLWYFEAPSKYVGSKSNAFGGYITWTYQTRRFNSNAQDPINALDLILESEPTPGSYRRVGVVNAVDPWKLKQTLVIALDNTTEWKVRKLISTTTLKQPTAHRLIPFAVGCRNALAARSSTANTRSRKMLRLRMYCRSCISSQRC